MLSSKQTPLKRLLQPAKWKHGFPSFFFSKFGRKKLTIIKALEFAQESDHVEN